MRRVSWVEKPEQPTGSEARKRGVVSCPLSPVMRLAFLYLLLVTVHTGYFVHRHGGGWVAVVVSAPAGFLLGGLLYFFGQGVSRLRERMLTSISPVLSGFLLFFLFLVSYVIVFSVVVSLPVEWCVKLQAGSSQLARQYVLYSVNLVLLLAMVSWLRWLLHQLGWWRYRESGGLK